MVGKWSRGAVARVVMPSAIALLLFIAYSVLVHLFNFTLDTTRLPWDATLFVVIWSLLFCSFLRGAFSSPGVVQRGWFRKYPVLHQELRAKFEKYKVAMKQQEEYMKRFQQRQQQRTSDSGGSAGSGGSEHSEKCCADHPNGHSDHEHHHGGNEETRLLVEEKEEMPEHFARPPRSHFCYELGANVQRMDHFCVWFNNAVGFSNYKYFLLSISYLLVESVLTVLILIYRVFIRSYFPQRIGFLNTLCLVLTFIICVFFAAFAGMHATMHWYQISKNLTSIEYHKFIQVKAMAAHFGVHWPDTHEYDHGAFENVKKWIGDDIWFWCIPTAPALSGDGYKFAVNAENRAKSMRVTALLQEKREAMWKKAKLGMNAKTAAANAAASAPNARPQETV